VKLCRDAASDKFFGRTISATETKQPEKNAGIPEAHGSRHRHQSPQYTHVPYGSGGGAIADQIAQNLCKRSQQFRWP